MIKFFVITSRQRFVLFAKYNYNDQVEKDEMGRVYLRKYSSGMSCEHGSVHSNSIKSVEFLESVN
jgi:hypothetical protein